MNTAAERLGVAADLLQPQGVHRRFQQYIIPAVQFEQYDFISIISAALFTQHTFTFCMKIAVSAVVDKDNVRSGSRVKAIAHCARMESHAVEL